jgi:glyoxylase-like metal-dependent hydrolase (beta-lactamase superfamily II)
MFIQPIYVKGLSHISYLIGGAKDCAIIDPKRDVDDYLLAAEEMGYTITHVLITHQHADFVGGHTDLGKRLKPKIIVPKASECKFDHTPVSEGDTFRIEHLSFKVLETPGHTPDGACYVVTDTSRGSEAGVVFTGDTLFVGDVGRPDLFPGMAEELAAKLFASLQKLMALSDHTEVYPAHSAGSLCGKTMSAKRSSTIGYERLYNKALQFSNAGDFRKMLLSGMPAAPDHFSRCSAINKEGPVPASSLPLPEPLLPKAFDQRLRDGAMVLDVRSVSAFGGGHIPSSIHIDITSNFQTFAGWILPPDKDLLLVAETEADVLAAVTGLRRVGLDRVRGYLKGGIHRWTVETLPVNAVGQVTIHELRNQSSKGVCLLDVRTNTEFESGHIKNALNIAAPDLRTRYKEVPAGPVVLICSTGHRSSMAASILLAKGLKDVRHVPGGMTAWAAAGFNF